MNQLSYPMGQRSGGGPGWPVDTTPSNGRTATAGAEIQFGSAVQRGVAKQVLPLVPGGTFDGIAGAGRVTRHGVGTHDQYDNVMVYDAGRWWGIADLAMAEGAGLNWNSSTNRWTTAAPGGAIVATPGVEADAKANGQGHEIPIRIKRIRR